MELELAGRIVWEVGGICCALAAAAKGCEELTCRDFENCSSVRPEYQLVQIYLLISPAGITVPLSSNSVVFSLCWKPILE